MKLRSALAPWLLFALGCGPAISPSMKAATDARLGSYASLEDVESPYSYEPQEWKPGQWVAYRVTERDQPPAVVTVKVVSQEAHGYWIETETQDYFGRTVSKALYSKIPATPDEAVEALTKVVLKTDGDPAQEYDFRTGPSATLQKDELRHVAAGLVAPVDASGLPKETITVPAGRFEGAAKYEGTTSFGGMTQPVTSWFHPDVPLNGSVRSVTSDGRLSLDLLAYGDSGATSTLR